MTGNKKIRSLGFIAGFLLLTNIIMLIFFLGITDGRRGMHIKDSIIGNFLKKDIGFDDKQMEAYQMLRKNDIDSIKPFFTSLRNAKDSFYRFVSRSTTDSEIVEKSKDIGEKQMQVDQQMLIHFKKVRSICTNQQLTKFDSLFKNVIEKITTGRIKKNYKD